MWGLVQCCDGTDQSCCNGRLFLQSWVGNILLFVNPYEQAGPSTHVVLSRLAELLLADMPSFRESRVLVFGGLSGSGKTFNADHLLMKMYQLADKTDWLLDLRKVRYFRGKQEIRSCEKVLNFAQVLPLGDLYIYTVIIVPPFVCIYFFHTLYRFVLV